MREEALPSGSLVLSTNKSSVLYDPSLLIGGEIMGASEDTMTPFGSLGFRGRTVIGLIGCILALGGGRGGAIGGGTL